MTEKPEWRLKGQLLTLTLPLSDTVAVIKAKIHEETGMPPGKQKLQWEVYMRIATSESSIFFILFNVLFGFGLSNFLNSTLMQWTLD
jgi:hypothetical protein